MLRRAERSACDQFAAALPGVLGVPTAVPETMASHVECCLACQAELARYRRLLRMLAQLGGERVELPAGALAELLECVGAAARRRAVRSALLGHRLAYGTGLAAAAAAAAGLLAVGHLRGTHQPART